MFKDIEYEKDGVKKMASERFRGALEEAGWSVVEEEQEPAVRKSPGRPKKSKK